MLNDEEKKLIDRIGLLVSINSTQPFIFFDGMKYIPNERIIFKGNPIFAENKKSIDELVDSQQVYSPEFLKGLIDNIVMSCSLLYIGIGGVSIDKNTKKSIHELKDEVALHHHKEITRHHQSKGGKSKPDNESPAFLAWQQYQQDKAQGNPTYKTDIDFIKAEITTVGERQARSWIKCWKKGKRYPCKT